MLRIGICDDAIESRFALHSALERLSSGCICYEFSSGEGVLSWLQKHPDTLNLLFLDIEMNGISGMETAQTDSRSPDSYSNRIFNRICRLCI